MGRRNNLQKRVLWLLRRRRGMQMNKEFMMTRIIQTLLPAMLLALPAMSHAQQSLPPDHVPIGAVETVYVKVANGVFMEVKLARVKNPTETWSDVRMRQVSADKPRNELAKNPEGVAVAKGDVVQLVIASAPEFSASPMAETTRITTRIAPAGSALAQQFERSQQTALTLADRK